jgi:hypothetical protein
MLLPVLMLPVLLNAIPAAAQTTASGAINATLIHKSGISLVFDANSGGVLLGGNGSSAGTLNLGSVSAFGPLAPGVVRSSVGPGSYTVGTLFNIQVIEGGLASTSYRLAAQLSAAGPTGLSFLVDGVALTTAPSALQASASFNTDVQHILNLVVSTAAPGAGGPSIGAPLTTTLNFTATAN